MPENGATATPADRRGRHLLGRMRTIVIADTVMGLDNVLAVAGAAHGSFLLVVLGLLISIPIVIWGSTLILQVRRALPGRSSTSAPACSPGPRSR